MTRKVKTVATLVVATLIFGWLVNAVAFDGFPPGKWWANRELGSKLQLSSTQVAEIEKLFTDERRRLIDLKAEAEKRDLDLEALLQANTLDQPKLEAAIDRVNEARAGLNKARLLTQVRVWQLLTPEQRQQVRAWQTERRAQERGRPHRDKHEDAEGRGKKGRAHLEADSPVLGAFSLAFPREGEAD